MAEEQDSKKAARQLLAMAVVLGGEAMAVGMNRIVDGKCPNCGEDAHDNWECCHKYVEEDNG